MVQTHMAKQAQMVGLVVAALRMAGAVAVREVQPHLEKETMEEAPLDQT
jgi:hypothetical protein